MFQFFLLRWSYHPTRARRASWRKKIAYTGLSKYSKLTRRNNPRYHTPKYWIYAGIKLCCVDGFSYEFLVRLSYVKCISGGSCTLHRYFTDKRKLFDKFFFSDIELKRTTSDRQQPRNERERNDPRNCLVDTPENFRWLQRESKPWPLRCSCNDLPTELWSHTVGSRSICWAH